MASSPYIPGSFQILCPDFPPVGSTRSYMRRLEDEPGNVRHDMIIDKDDCFKLIGPRGAIFNELQSSGCKVFVLYKDDAPPGWPTHQRLVVLIGTIEQVHNCGERVNALLLGPAPPGQRAIPPRRPVHAHAPPPAMPTAPPQPPFPPMPYEQRGVGQAALADPAHYYAAAAAPVVSSPYPPPWPPPPAAAPPVPPPVPLPYPTAWPPLAPVAPAAPPAYPPPWPPPPPPPAWAQPRAPSFQPQILCADWPPKGSTSWLMASLEERPEHVRHDILIEDCEGKKLIGRGGRIFKELESSTGCRLFALLRDGPPPGFHSDHRLICLIGTPSQVSACAIRCYTRLGRPALTAPAPPSAPPPYPTHAPPPYPTHPPPPYPTHAPPPYPTHAPPPYPMPAAPPHAPALSAPTSQPCAPPHAPPYPTPHEHTGMARQSAAPPHAHPPAPVTHAAPQPPDATSTADPSAEDEQESGGVKRQKL